MTMMCHHRRVHRLLMHGCDAGSHGRGLACSLKSIGAHFDSGGRAQRQQQPLYGLKKKNKKNRPPQGGKGHQFLKPRGVDVLRKLMQLSPVSGQVSGGTPSHLPTPPSQKRRPSSPPPCCGHPGAERLPRTPTARRSSNHGCGPTWAAPRTRPLPARGLHLRSLSRHRAPPLRPIPG